MVKNRLYFTCSPPRLFIKKKNDCSNIFHVLKVGDTVIGTHFIDLSTISHDGDKGEKEHFLQNIFKLKMLIRIPAYLWSSICTPLRVNQRLQLDRRTFNTEWWSRRRCFIQVFLFILFENIWYWIVFRGQILIAIKTEISDSIDTAPSEVEVEQTQTINEVTLWSYSDRYLNN